MEIARVSARAIMKRVCHSCLPIVVQGTASTAYRCLKKVLTTGAENSGRQLARDCLRASTMNSFRPPLRPSDVMYAAMSSRGSANVCSAKV